MTMNLQQITRILTAAVLLILLTACTTGGKKLPADKAAITQLDRIAVFSCRYEPTYEYRDGMTAERTNRGEIPPTHNLRSMDLQHNRIPWIKDSGVYDVFEHELTKQLEAASGTEVSLLSKSDFLEAGEEGEELMNALATCRSRGFAAILVAYITPTLYETKEDHNIRSMAGGLDVKVVLQRLEDSAILWQESYAVGGTRYTTTSPTTFPSWFDIGKDAATEVVRGYLSAK